MDNVNIASSVPLAASMALLPSIMQELEITNSAGGNMYCPGFAKACQ